MPKIQYLHLYTKVITEYCQQHELLSPGQLIVAVSGGADSLMLLHILLELRSNFDITPHIATLDHGIRGAAGAADVAFVEEIAAKWNVLVTTERINVPAYAQQHKLGIEEVARKLRYDFLSRVAYSIGANTIAVGHNANDQAETVLMHLLRGAGLKGLRGMLPKTQLPNSLFVVRPLLGLSRTDIDSYIKAIGVTPRNDETNHDTVYSRNRIRHDILPFLQDNGYPHIYSVLARLSEIARDDYDALQSCLPEPEIDTQTGNVSISWQAFVKMLPGQQRAFLRNSVDELTKGDNPELSFAYIDAVRQRLIQTQKFKELALGAVKIHLDGKNIVLGLDSSAAASSSPDYPLMSIGATISITSAGVYPISDAGWQVRVEQITTLPDKSIIQDGNPYKVIVAVQEGARIQFRTRKQGDHFKPNGMHGKSQKLQDTLVNMGVPAQLREQIPLLVINDEIAWFITATKSGVRSRIAETFTVQSDQQGLLWQFTFYRPENAIY